MPDKEKEASSNPVPLPAANENKSSVAGGMIAVLIALLVVALVVSGVFYFILKNNVFGLGEAYRSRLENVPVFKLALPPAPPKQTVKEDEDPNKLTEEDLRERYTTYRAEIDKLEKQLEDANKAIEQYQKDQQGQTDSTKVLEENQAVLKTIEEEKKKLETDKAAFADMVAAGDKAGFEQYYKQIDAANAERIFKELAKADVTLENKKALAEPFTTMDPTSAARLLEELYASDSVSAVSVFEGLDSKKAAKILEQMDPVIAAKVTKVLADKKLGE